jgi:hypothetical protein
MPTLMETVGGITPIIDTFRARSLGEERNAIRAAYEPNAARFFASDTMQALRKSLVERAGKGERCLGYLQAPYGHGKTAAAIYLWRECEKAGALAVPPFQFTSLDNVVTGVGGFVEQALRDKNGALAREAEALAAQYRTDAVDRVAETLARQHRIPLETARAIAAQEIAARNSVGRSAHLADYLVGCARLAEKAGFKSLCVFLDEMQLFIDSGDTRENVENFRQLILALRGETAPLGLIFVVHERVGMVLEEQAGDAMQRLRADGAGLNLGQFRETTFPARLLEHLCKICGEKPAEVAEEAVLEALGQIAVRDDLSNGPRTVAAALRAIGRRRAQTGKRYTVWDLARDYEQREIVFDGAERSLAGALAQLLSDDIVRERKTFGDVVRYLTMFPDGASETFLKREGLLNPLTELAQERGLLGTVIYAPRAEHWALKALQQTPGNDDRVTAVVRLFRDNFWYRQTPAGQLATARQAFARLLLPELFPRRAQGDAGRKFSGHPAANKLSDQTPIEILLTGSYEGTVSLFPERRVAVAIASSANELDAFRPSDPDAHLWFTFLLTDQLAPEAPGKLHTAHSDPRLAFMLNLKTGIGSDYPPELNLLKDSIVPRQCNALILLNLLFYIEDMIPRMNLPESDRAQIREYLTRSALRMVIQMLFDSEHLEVVGTNAAVGRGTPLLEKLFAAKLQERYPQYRALQAGPESAADLERYERLLRDGGFSLPVKRGQRPIRLAAREFLARMGASQNSAFDATASRLKRLQLLTAGGEESIEGVRTLEFTLREHPLEALLHDEIEKNGLEVTVRRGGRDLGTRRLDKGALLRVARRNGYGPNEMELALKMAGWRQRLETEGNHVLISVAADDPEALLREADELSRHIADFAGLDPGAAELKNRCEQIARLIPSADADGLSEASLELRLLAERVKERVDAVVREQRAEIERLRGRIADAVRGLPLAEAGRAITLPGSLGGVLETSRKRLERSLLSAKAEWEQLAGQLKALSDGMAVDTPTTLLDNTLHRREKLASICKSLDHASGFLRATNAHLANLAHWRTLAATAEQVEFALADQGQDLSRTLADWIDSVVDAARSSGTDFADFLGRYSDFKPGLEAIEAQSRGMEQQRRERYEAFARQVGELMRGARLSSPRAIPFDPRAEEQSYQALADEVTRILGDAITRLIGTLVETSARATFLSEFRGRDVKTLQQRLEKAQRELLSIGTDLVTEAVLNYRSNTGKFPAYCGAYQSALTECSSCNASLVALEKPDPARGGLEDEILLWLQQSESAGQGVALAQIFGALRRKRTVTANDLFAALEALYTQGNIELLIRERSR